MRTGSTARTSTDGAATADGPAAAGPGDPVRVGPIGRARDLLDRHPLVVVAGLTALVAVGHAVWIWTHRRVGAYDPDEAGYIANALRFQRSIDPLAPWQFLRAVATTGTGPVVPLLSLPFLVAGPRDPRTALLVQPVLTVVTCVAVAGITRRLAGPRSAVVAGVATALAPTTVLASQSYWLGLGAATWCALAVWCLLASDRLRNDWAWLFGALVGLMVMTRTMALGFAPAVYLGGIVLAGTDRRSWVGLLRAGAATVLVAGPWWLVNLRGLTEYLFSYGYGPRAGLFGEGDVVDRAAFRWDRLAEGVGADLMLPERWMVLALVAAVLVSAGATTAVRWRRGGGPPRALREGLAVTATVAAGWAALVSTTNNGVWFELPMVVLVVALVSAAAAPGWRPLRWLTAVVLLSSGLLHLPTWWWWTAPDPAMTAHYEYGFAGYDERFGPDRRAELPVAAADWAAASAAVADALAEVGADGREVLALMSGNMQLTNSNSVTLAGELAGHPVVVAIPDTEGPEAELRAQLRPFGVDPVGPGSEQVVVLLIHDQQRFTPDARLERFAELARELGWQPWRTLPLPDGGRAVVLRHPASQP